MSYPKVNIPDAALEYCFNERCDGRGWRVIHADATEIYGIKCSISSLEKQVAKWCFRNGKILARAREQNPSPIISVPDKPYMKPRFGRFEDVTAEEVRGAFNAYTAR